MSKSCTCGHEQLKHSPFRMVEGDITVEEFNRPSNKIPWMARTRCSECECDRFVEEKTEFAEDASNSFRITAFPKVFEDFKKSFRELNSENYLEFFKNNDYRIVISPNHPQRNYEMLYKGKVINKGKWADSTEQFYQYCFQFLAEHYQNK